MEQLQHLSTERSWTYRPESVEEVVDRLRRILDAATLDYLHASNEREIGRGYRRKRTQKDQQMAQVRVKTLSGAIWRITVQATPFVEEMNSADRVKLAHFEKTGRRLVKASAPQGVDPEVWEAAPYEYEEEGF